MSAAFDWKTICAAALIAMIAVDPGAALHVAAAALVILTELQIRVLLGALWVFQQVGG